MLCFKLLRLKVSHEDSSAFLGYFQKFAHFTVKSCQRPMTYVPKTPVEILI